MKKSILLFLVLLFISCSTNEVIGNYNYSTKTNRVNCGEFDALIFKSKVFITKKKDTVFSNLIKAQKLDFETKKDSVFAYGKLEIEKENNKTYIITKEININGYDKYTETDSVIRKYEQFVNGNVFLKSYISYRNGKIKNKYSY